MIGGGEAKERKVGETKVAKSNRFGIATGAFVKEEAIIH